MLSVFVVFLTTIFGTSFFIEIERQDKIFIKDVEPIKVFLVFGNFTNFFVLEPNLIRYKLKAEFDGEKMVNFTNAMKYNKFEINHRDRLLKNNQTWSYRVWYEEYYQYLPAILTNKNEGHFIMSRISSSGRNGKSGIKDYNDTKHVESKEDLDEELLQVESYHETEFLPGRPISTKAINLFKKETKNEKESGTLVMETLYYTTPLLFLPLAIAEVEAQRPKVLKTLSKWKFV